MKQVVGLLIFFSYNKVIPSTVTSPILTPTPIVYMSSFQICRNIFLQVNTHSKCFHSIYIAVNFQLNAFMSAYCHSCCDLQIIMFITNLSQKHPRGNKISQLGTTPYEVEVTNLNFHLEAKTYLEKKNNNNLSKIIIKFSFSSKS